MNRGRKCKPIPTPGDGANVYASAAPSNGNGYGAWTSFWKLIAVAAVGAILTLGAVLYGDVKSALADHDVRLRVVESRQAVQDSTRADIERRLKEISDKLDEVLRQQRDGK